MHVAYLTGEYPRATDTFIQREVMTLRDKGVEVDTFSIRKTGDEHIVGAEQKAERDRTFYILPEAKPIPTLLAHISLFLSSPQRYLQAAKLAWDTHTPGIRGTIYQFFYFAEAGILAHQIQQRQIQHLHNHFGDSSCSVAMLAAALGGFSFSFTMHGPYIFFDPLRWRLDEKLKRSLFTNCISNFCRSQGMIFAPSEQWNRMHIVHCGIAPELFSLKTHSDPGRHLLFTGRLADVKGLPILLEGLSIVKRSHPDIELTVVGDGPDRTKLEAMTAQLDLQENVKFVGYQSQANVREFMQQTDMFVMSSFAEGVPVVLMEAMAAGVPVIATQIAGISELVEDGVNGYLVPAGDPVKLADRIEKLLESAEWRSKLGKAGRSKVEQEFNIHQEVERLYQIMTAALRGEVVAVRPELPGEEVSDREPELEAANVAV